MSDGPSAMAIVDNNNSAGNKKRRLYREVIRNHHTPETIHGDRSELFIGYLTDYHLQAWFGHGETGIS